MLCNSISNDDVGPAVAATATTATNVASVVCVTSGNANLNGIFRLHCKFIKYFLCDGDGQ